MIYTRNATFAPRAMAMTSYLLVYTQPAECMRCVSATEANNLHNMASDIPRGDGLANAAGNAIGIRSLAGYFASLPMYTDPVGLAFMLVRCNEQRQIHQFTPNVCERYRNTHLHKHVSHKHSIVNTTNQSPYTRARARECVRYRIHATNVLV
jgi:hypothetical protein